MAEHSPEKVNHTFLNTGSNMGVVSLLVWICDEQLGFKILVVKVTKYNFTNKLRNRVEDKAVGPQCYSKTNPCNRTFSIAAAESRRSMGIEAFIVHLWY